MKSCLVWLNLFCNLSRFLVLGLRSKTALAAENLFLRANSSPSIYREARRRAVTEHVLMSRGDERIEKSV
jgi:hypothetical protein